jgi:hypothetical protein
VQLAGSCSSSDPNAQLVYVIDGQQALTAKCPEPGASVQVLVRPTYPLRQDCCYNAEQGFTLTSERSKPAAAAEAHQPLPPDCMRLGASRA